MRVFSLAIACTVATLAAPAVAQDESDANKPSQTFELGQIIVQSECTERESVGLKISLDQALSDPATSTALSCP